MYKILEIIPERRSTYIKYNKRVQCAQCGTIKISTDSRKELPKCIVCHTTEKQQEIVGKTIGTFLVLSYYGRGKNDAFLYNTKCTVCNKEAIKRKDCIKQETICRGCSGNNVKPTIKAPRNVLLGVYKTNAKLRNYEFTITESEFDILINSKCYYCGAIPSIHKSEMRYNKTKVEFLRNGIDRKDSSKGYTSENSVTCCAMCNRMKMAFHIDEWLIQITRIYKNIIECSTTIPQGSTLK
jgi:hypothetical protein